MSVGSRNSSAAARSRSRCASQCAPRQLLSQKYPSRYSYQAGLSFTAPLWRRTPTTTGITWPRNTAVASLIRPPMGRPPHNLPLLDMASGVSVCHHEHRHLSRTSNREESGSAIVSVAIEVERLVKAYKKVSALDGLDLTVPEGTVLGLLGPNGAGKTTCVRILATLLRPDSGRALVGGIDVVERPQEARRIIGLSGQYAAVDEHLTAAENLEMIGRLYHLGKREARARAWELLERFDLSDVAGRTVKTYSGGMRRRLDLAGALVAHPPVIFLDEPTTGLDPRSRLGLWKVIGERVREGVTLLLTTQYMEEADQLADDIAVIDHGTVIARGKPDELKVQVGGERLEVAVEDREDLATKRVTVPVASGVRALTDAVRQLDVGEVQVVDIGLRRPTLDDVFLQLTGHRAADEDADTTGKTDKKTDQAKVGSR